MHCKVGDAFCHPRNYEFGGSSVGRVSAVSLAEFGNTFSGEEPSGGGIFVRGELVVAIKIGSGEQVVSWFFLNGDHFFHGGDGEA